MPKSKRNKVVSLTKAKKVDRDQKAQLVDDIRACAKEYTTLYVFTYSNLRTNKMDAIRAKFRSGRFFLGRNKVMSLALGRTPESEHQDNIHRVTPYMRENCGLFFTNDPPDYIQSFFRDYSSTDYARAGCVADREITIPAGPLSGFQHTMQPYLHDLGMPVELKNAVVMLTRDHVICRKGATLNAAQAKLLKLFEVQLASFSMTLEVMWSDGEVTALTDYQPEGEGADGGEQGEEEVPMLSGGFVQGDDDEGLELNLGGDPSALKAPEYEFDDMEQEEAPRKTRSSSRKKHK